MRDGRLVQVGTPAEVYERPNTPLRRRVPWCGEHPASDRARETGRDWSCLAGVHGMHRDRQFRRGRLLLAIRPERVRLGGIGRDRIALQGVVVDRSYAGETADAHACVWPMAA